jgi:shikimate kinase
MGADCNVVLTGFMGTGKTTVGRVLAERLQYSFVDTDAVIEARHGPVADIFRDQGEPEFRRIERELALELADHECLVVATGGGMMADAVSALALAGSGHVFCLTATPDTILRRVSEDRSVSERPLLAVGDPAQIRERIVELLGDRAEVYGQFTQIDTEGRTLDDVVSELIGRINGS